LHIFGKTGGTGYVLGDVQKMEALPSVLQAVMQRCARWMERMFSEGLSTNKRERALRLLEEANEFAQAAGVSRLDASIVQDHVYEREPGEPAKEIAGVLLTTLAYCVCNDIDPGEELLKELTRIEAPEFEERIRAAQVRKTAAGLSSHVEQREQLTRAERLKKLSRFICAGLGCPAGRVPQVR
jgi:hypothetical protein